MSADRPDLYRWTVPFRLLLALLATVLVGQAVVVGAHRHDPSSATVATLSRTAGHLDSHGCTICEMQRVGGQYLPAVAAIVAEMPATSWLVGEPGGIALPRLGAVVGWRSRAPPVAG